MPKILVADDSIAVRKVAERLLTEAGLGVALAANGEEALAFLGKEQPDLVVTDVIMPDKSGYEVCAFVRSQSALAKIPVLLISGIVNDEVTKQAAFCRADGVLKKPFQGTSLKDRVLDLLSKHQSQTLAVTGGEATGSGAINRIGQTTQTGPIPVAPAADGPKAYKISEEQLQTFRQSTAKVKELDDALEKERSKAVQLSERLADLERDAARVRGIEADLAKERTKSAQLSDRVTQLEQAANRLKEVEAQLAAERERSAQMTKRAADADRLKTRVEELEATLIAERDAAAQLVQQLNDSERTAARAKELDVALAEERHKAGDLSRRLNEAEREAARGKELEAALSTERENNSQLNQRIAQLELAMARVKELERTVVSEQERTSQLTQRASEAEQVAQQANRRLEDMARKLGEIAGLASQLGQGKTR